MDVGIFAGICAWERVSGAGNKNLKSIADFRLAISDFETRI
jgi:hypothetical protein